MQGGPGYIEWLMSQLAVRRMKPDEFRGDTTEVTNELLRWKDLASRRLNDWETNLIRIIRQVKDNKQ